jgi:hypothetical protein
VKSNDLSINIQGVPVDVPARTIKKKKRKEKRAERRRKMKTSGGESKAVPSSVTTPGANKELFPDPIGDNPSGSRRKSMSRAERRMSIAEEQGDGPAPEEYIPATKPMTNQTFDRTTAMDIVDLRELYYEADEQTQEDLMEDIIDEIDKICHFASYQGVKPGDLLFDKDGSWDGTPEDLVTDMTRLGWDLVHFADNLVDMDEDDENFEKVRRSDVVVGRHAPTHHHKHVQTTNPPPPPPPHSTRTPTSSPFTRSGLGASESLGLSLRRNTLTYYAALV